LAKRNIIGERVKLARKQAVPKITQRHLAEQLQLQGLQIERATISKIETGYRDVTDVEVAAIAKALHATISWLFGESN